MDNSNTDISSMNFLDLVKATRTCRRFRESEGLPEGTLTWLCECARYTSCATNGQALRFALVESREAREAIFPLLTFAGMLKDGAPMEGERPAGYIVILGEKGRRETFNLLDAGLVSQTMQLAAQTRDIGTCIVYSLKHEKVAELVGTQTMERDLWPLLVLAFGMQKEKRVVVDAEDATNLKYWRDERGVHHVPKLPLATLIVKRL